MENTYRIQFLLDNVGIIAKKYDDIAKLTGENFNIFSVMNMEWDEVKTHSAIIGELINPKGKHGQGDIFLKIFIKQLNKKFSLFEKTFQIETFQDLVGGKICERTISLVNLINGTGGRIDIILEDKNQLIIIENKPGNQDQALQLIRYSNYAKTKNKPFKIFYLTTNGRNLVEEESYILDDREVKGYNFHYSRKDEFENFQLINSSNIIGHKCLYYPISFRTDIKDWLEVCHKEAIEQPILRETIKQYLNLIKKITNQNTNDTMSAEIKQIIIKNLKSSREIFNNFQSAKFEIGESIRNGVIEGLNERLDKNKFKTIKGDDKNSQIWIDLIQYSQLGIPFGIESFNGTQEQLQIGIIDFEARNKQIFNVYRTDETENNQYWIRVKDIVYKEKTLDFDNLDFLETVVNSDKENIIKTIVDQIEDYILINYDLIKEINTKVLDL